MGLLLTCGEATTKLRWFSSILDVARQPRLLRLGGLSDLADEHRIVIAHPGPEKDRARGLSHKETPNGELCVAVPARSVPTVVRPGCDSGLMSADQNFDETQAAYDVAAAHRDAAVEKVTAAFRDRAREWLTWVAYSIADRNAGKVDRETVATIKETVAGLVSQAEEGELPLNYGSVYKDDREATWGGAAHIVDQATIGYLTNLGQRLRQLDLEPTQYFPEDSHVSRFKGDDGFSNLLKAWAEAETAFRQAEQHHKANKSHNDKVSLREMWGDDAPGQPAPNENGLNRSRDWF